MITTLDCRQSVENIASAPTLIAKNKVECSAADMASAYATNVTVTMAGVEKTARVASAKITANRQVREMPSCDYH